MTRVTCVLVGILPQHHPPHFAHDYLAIYCFVFRSITTRPGVGRMAPIMDTSYLNVNSIGVRAIIASDRSWELLKRPVFIGPWSLVVSITHWLRKKERKKKKEAHSWSENIDIIRYKSFGFVANDPHSFFGNAW